jgi:hypothetical protein
MAWVIAPVSAHAQASPTPTATPSPASISTLPNGDPVTCFTGAEPPPSYLGISGGNINSIVIQKTGGVSCYAGTLGALVQDSSGNQYVLSTNTVLARVSGKKSAKRGEAIVQPGLQDTGCWQSQNDGVAQLSKWVPINFKGENQMDAAIAKVVPAVPMPSATPTVGVWPDGRIFNLGTANPSPHYSDVGYVSTTTYPYDQLIDDMLVMKMGRSSCLTAGKVDAWDAMGQVVYPNTNNNASSGVALFDHQIIIFGADPETGAPGAFASAGDSGSLVVTFDFDCPQAIGLVFAGASGAGADSGGTIVAVNPIDPILNKFGVTLVGQTCSPSSPIRQVRGAEVPADISDTLRASIERVRSIKTRYARSLLRMRGVVAVGIGGGSTPDSAALKVYVDEDNPQIPDRVRSEIRGATEVNIRRIGGRFKAL